MAARETDNPYAAPSSPLEAPRTAPVSVKKELLEWLGLKPADLLVYLAIAALIGMFYFKNAALDVVLAVAAVLLTLVSCPIGMKHEPQISRFSNIVRLISYPTAVVIAVAAILVHYLWWVGRWGG